MSILKATEYGEEFYYLAAYFSPILLAIPSLRSAVLQKRWLGTSFTLHDHN